MSDKRTLRNFINGESVDSVEGRTSDLVDPSTGEVFGTAPVSGAEDVDRAYAAAATAVSSCWNEADAASPAGPCRADSASRRAKRTTG